MTMLKRALFLPPVALGAALIWQALAVQPDPPVVAAEERRVAVAFVTAEPRRFQPTIKGYGTVAPGRVWTGIAQVSGNVVYLNPAFARGGFIEEGEVLLRLSAQDYDLALATAEADLSSANARMDELRVSGQNTAAALEIEEQSLSLAEADLVRTEELAKRGVVSEAVLQTQKREVLAQRTKVQSLESTLALLPAQIKAQEQSAAAARLAKRAAELDLHRTVITAPFEGRVASADVEISQFVSAGATIGVLDGIAVAEIDVQVSQQRATDLARLSHAAGTAAKAAGIDGTAAIPTASRAKTAAPPDGDGPALSDPSGLTAEVSLGSGRAAHSWSARVARTSDSVSAETRSLGMIVEVPRPYDRTGPGARPALTKGTFVTVEIAAPALDRVILLPRRAIQNGKVMLVGPDDRLVFAPVRDAVAFDDIAVLAPDALPQGARV
ncbi:MAG: HlyD family efflux transporter periplasmic adaptor subunit, partial [Pseudomonadota bacterium]